MAAYLLVALLYTRVLVGAVLVGLAMCWLGWKVLRRWRAASVVFDRSEDSISQGALQIGRVSAVAGVQITGARAPALEMFLSDSNGAAILWPVPDVDGAHAHEIGRAIADYLDVPLVTRIP